MVHLSKSSKMSMNLRSLSLVLIVFLTEHKTSGLKEETEEMPAAIAAAVAALGEADRAVDATFALVEATL